jgi:PKD repeat protein
VTAAHHVPPSFWSRLAIGCLVAACGGGDLALPNGESVLGIQVVGGDGQRGSVGEPLASPVVVQVTDENGDPVEGATVEFVLTSAGDGGGITPSTARTSAAGRAEAHVLLGDKVGVQTGEARVAGDSDTRPKTTFSALAEETDDNRPPTADFGWSCEALACRFTDGSTDGDGSLTGWAWRFGDGSTSAEREPNHRYDAAGTYVVRLTVTDDEGATDELTDEVTVTAPSMPPSNEAPRAEFDVDCEDLTCTFTDRSEDEDGNIESRRWEFGDGSGSSQTDPSHTYASPGRYDVVLRVTDDDGAEDTRTRTAEPDSPTPPPPPPPPPNAPPEAEFEVDCQDLQCTFVDRSRDDDGSIVSWEWNFGDGATSRERNPSHVYTAPGHYDVLLVVTDDDGAADTRIHTADPEAPPSPEPNRPPDADFEVRCDGLTCTFSDKSKDEDGAVVSWHWSFGDGDASEEQNPVHTYAARGHYEVLLTVEDDRGATDTKDRRADPKD